MPGSDPGSISSSGSILKTLPRRSLVFADVLRAS